jgi:hypothetical protein
MFWGHLVLLRWEAVGVFPPLGSSLKLQLSLGVYMDSEAARNVLVRVKRVGFAEAGMN